MKKIFLIAFGLLITISGSKAQSILVANSKPGAVTGANVFVGPTAIQDAINAASATTPYDIIYVVPSSVTYNNITIDRGITIYGIGLRPAKDGGARSRLDRVFIESSNVRISGLVSGSPWFIGSGSSSTTLTNITIENSRFRDLSQNSNPTLAIDQLLIRNNVILNNNWGSITLYVTSNVTITNNVIYCEVLNGGMVGNDLIVYNNLFINNGSGTNLSALTNVDNSLFDHNIFYGASPSNTINNISTGNTWDNNLSWATVNDVFEVGLNGNTSNFPNLEGIDPLFVNMPLNGSWDNDYDLTLQVASPALNINGTDIGPSGGGVPFNSEGNILPLIQSVTMPAIIPVGSDLPVTIKAKGN